MSNGFAPVILLPLVWNIPSRKEDRTRIINDERDKNYRFVPLANFKYVKELAGIKTENITE